MMNQNNRQPLRIALAAAAFLAVAAAVTTWLLPARRTPAAPSGVVPAAPVTAPVARPTPAAEAPVVVAKPLSLEEMKDEFAELMKKRAGLLAKCETSQKIIVASRVTTDRSAPANAATAEEYRQKVLIVEHALDAHPRILAIQALYDVAQTDKVEVSRQQGEIIGSWEKARIAREDSRQAAAVVCVEKTDALRKEIMSQAGVKDMRKLSENDLRRLREGEALYTNDLNAVTMAYLRDSDEKAVTESHKKDGSKKKFDDYNERYAELEKQQDELNKQMQKLRDELRRTDPAIAQLQQEAYAASQRHLTAMAAQPEVAAAQSFLDDLSRLRATIDQRARVLHKEILAADPAFKPELDQQASSGGLALVGDAFWNVEG